MLVAITGGSGAGKTTVAMKIKERFDEKCVVIDMDNYYKDLEPGVDPREFNFDSPKALDLELFEEHLRMLKEGKKVRIPVYNMVTYRREKGIFNEIEPKDLIVVEGLFVIYTPSLRSLFDFKVYVDAPADERLIRRIERDTKERGRSIESILEQYRKFVAPSFRTFIEPQKYYCDLVLPWGGKNEIGLSIIINAIENLLKRNERAES